MNTYDFFLFAGQSNMAGRGISCPQFPEAAPALISGAGVEFRAISDPSALFSVCEPFGSAKNTPDGIHEPGMKTGSLVTSFVNAYYSLTGVPVLSVSASKGGSVIAQWQPGGAYLNDTIRRMHAAFDFCAAHGIVLRHRFLLWCQGESDGDHHTAPDVYAEQFCRMYETLRRENIEHCFLIGIGEYNGPAADISYDAIRNAQYALADHRSDLTVVSRSFVFCRGQALDAFGLISHFYFGSR